jgi:predicted lipase
MSSIVYENRRYMGSVRFSGTYDSQAMVHETSDGEVVVAFRGTESLTDWMVNLTRYKTQFVHLPHTRVHAGFLKQYNALRSQIMRHISRLSNEHTRIIVTGHSLGGALATLFAAELAHTIPKLSVSCYAFGSPRVGDASFVKAIHELSNLTIIRFNNAYDVIPWMPYFGFVHTNEVVHLRTTGIRWFDFRKRHSIRLMYIAYTRRSCIHSTRSEGDDL